MDNIEEINNFNRKVNKFISKYYKINLFKGIILSAIIISALIIAFSVFEYILWTNSHIRFTLLLTAVLIIFSVFGYFILIPFLRWAGLLKSLTQKNAVKIIKNNISEIDDTIINIIELQDIYDSNELVNASILQKVKKLENYNFTTAIGFKNNIKFIRQFFIIIILGIIIGFIEPKVYKDGIKRVIQYKLTYNKDLGYNLHLNTDDLNVRKGDDVLLEIISIGNKVPDELFVKLQGENFITKKRRNKFYYTFRNVNQDFTFYLVSQDFISKSYKIKVWSPPILSEFKINLEYPNYLNKPDESFNNESNFRVPEGTKITWNFEVLNADSLLFETQDTVVNIDNSNFTKVITNEVEYRIIGINTYEKNTLIGTSKIKYIPDKYPEIQVDILNDKEDEKIKYFKIYVSDDHGFKKAAFVLENHIVNIPVKNNVNQQVLYFAYDFSNCKNTTKYHFQITDNDAINGYKTTKSDEYTFIVPDLKQIKALEQTKTNELFQSIEKSELLSQALQKDIENLKKKLLTENLQTWKEKKLLDDIQKKQNELQNILNHLSKQNVENNKKFAQYQKMNQDLVKKQTQIENLLNEIMDEELKELVNKLNKLRKENYNKEEIKNLLEQFNLKYADIEKELDRNYELLKKFKIEKGLQDQINELEKIAKDQEHLANNKFDETLNKSNVEELKNLQNEYNNLKKDNNALENPMQMENLENDLQDLKNDIENNTTQRNKDNAAQNAKKSKNLADRMQQMLSNNTKSQQSENAQTIRQILENLFYFSFNEEKIELKFTNINKNDPGYIDLKEAQLKIKNDYHIIRDSLYAISKRNVGVGAHINNKAFDIEKRLIETENLLKKDKIGKVRNELRYLLTSSNDMILLLSESLKNMESMGGGGGGEQTKKSKKPKKGKPSGTDLRNMQQGLKQQLKEMLNQLKNGKTPGTSAIGKALAKQEVFEKMLDDLIMSGESGSKTNKLINEIKNYLNQNKRDLINNRIGQKTLERQKLIETRLLEAENAELEREKEEKRKSVEAKDYKIEHPEQVFENKKQISNFDEILKNKSLKLDNKYNTIYQEYINNLNNYPNEKRN